MAQGIVYPHGLVGSAMYGTVLSLVTVTNCQVWSVLGPLNPITKSGLSIPQFPTLPVV
jgi:hypothetical protein